MQLLWIAHLANELLAKITKEGIKKEIDQAEKNDCQYFWLSKERR